MYLIVFSLCSFCVGASKYLECAHAPLPDDDQRDWLVRGSEQHKILEGIVHNKTLLTDMKQLTHFCHTGSLENFHSVLLKWAPKRVHFSYQGMRARVQLACLSHNANIGRAHATTSEGVLRYRMEFTKSSKHWVAKRINEPSSYDFLKDVLQSVHEAVMEVRRGGMPPAMVAYNVPELPKNIATLDAPVKEDLVEQHMSRM